MSKLDDAIHDALSEEDAEFLERLQPEPVFIGMFWDIFKGPLRWINIAAAVAMIPMLAVGIWAVVEFIGAPDLRVMFLWFAAASLCTVGILLIRLWWGMCVQANRVIREIKRLELQVARLAARDTV